MASFWQKLESLATSNFFFHKKVVDVIDVPIEVFSGWRESKGDREGGLETCPSTGKFVLYIFCLPLGLEKEMNEFREINGPQKNAAP